ncbi:ISNCY family transposase [Vibrio parahaemolyticus]|nr:ISNCY family transposase [Vibrio parahaemolyticus]
MIIMDSRSQLTVDVIAKVTQGKISIHSASKLLNRSRCTIERYLHRYRREGIRFVVHGNKGREPVNKTPDSLKRQVQQLIQTKYFDFNLQHLAELLTVNEGLTIKRETLRKWAHAIHHVKRAKRRRSRVRKHRERMEQPGLMLQMDGSPHQWFGEHRSCLIAIIDDATSDIHAELFPSETTEGCMKVMKTYIEKRGLFKTLYVDRAGIFGGPKRSNFSQMQRACEELGIEIIFAISPQGKGRVERAFDTFQDRLVPELRLHHITDIQSANEYLQQQFIPLYWQQKIAVQAKNPRSAFKVVPEHINLDTICVHKEYRKVRRDHTFSYNNKMYLIDSPIRHSIVNQKLEIRCQFDGAFSAYFGHRKLHITELEEPPRASEYGMEVQRKLDVIELADRLGNATEAARITGCSRRSIYNYQKVLAEEGILGLKRINKPLHRSKNSIPEETEHKIIELTLNNPYQTSVQLRTMLKKEYNITVSSCTIRNIWKREALNTRELRIQRSTALNKEV